MRTFKIIIAMCLSFFLWATPVYADGILLKTNVRVEYADYDGAKSYIPIPEASLDWYGRYGGGWEHVQDKEIKTNSLGYSENGVNNCNGKSHLKLMTSSIDSAYLPAGGTWRTELTKTSDGIYTGLLVPIDTDEGIRDYDDERLSDPYNSTFDGSCNGGVGCWVNNGVKSSEAYLIADELRAIVVALSGNSGGTATVTYTYVAPAPRPRIAGCFYDRATNTQITTGTSYARLIVKNETSGKTVFLSGIVGPGTTDLDSSGCWRVDDLVSTGDTYSVAKDDLTPPTGYINPPGTYNSGAKADGTTPIVDGSTAFIRQIVGNSDCGLYCNFAFEPSTPAIPKVAPSVQCNATTGSPAVFTWDQVAAAKRYILRIDKVNACPNVTAPYHWFCGPSNVVPANTDQYGEDQYLLLVLAQNGDLTLNSAKVGACINGSCSISRQILPNAAYLNASIQWHPDATGEIVANLDYMGYSAAFNCPVACTIGAVRDVTASFVFDSLFTPQDISWTQAKEAVATTRYFTVNFARFTDDDPLKTKTSITTVTYDVDSLTAPQYLEVLDTGDRKYTVTLEELTVETIYNALSAGSNNKLAIEVIPLDGDVNSCPGTSSSTLVSTQRKVVVKVRETASTTSCTGDTAPTSLVPNGFGIVGGSATTSNNDIVATIPTAQKLSAYYTFSNDAYSCNSCGAQDNSTVGISKTCKKLDQSGFEVTLYISQLNISSWWEVIGGLAYGKATLGVALPIDSGLPTLCPVGPAGRTCAPFLMRSPTYDQSKRAGISLAGSLALNDTGWASERNDNERASGVPSFNANALKKKDLFAYNHYLSLIPGEKLTSTSNTSLGSLSDLPETGVKPKYFVTTGSLTINPTSPITVSNGEKYIIFVNGSLTIGDNAFNPTGLGKLIQVENGGFLAFFVRGPITIKPTVGTDLPSTTPAAGSGVGQDAPPLTNTNLDGIYVADGIITIETNNPSNEADIVPDKRFIGAGSFVSAADIVMNRTYSRDGVGNEYSKTLSGFTPTEVFRHRPDMVLATPIELKQAILQYQEIR